jgi:hypothetical protein
MMSVCPSIQLLNQLTDVQEIWYKPHAMSDDPSPVLLNLVQLVIA